MMKALIVTAAFMACVFAATTVAEAQAAAKCSQMCSAGCSKRYPGGGASFDRCKERCFSLKCNK